MLSLSAVVYAVFFIIIAGAIFALLYWLVNSSKVALPEPFRMVANGILAVASVGVLIGVLLQLLGVPVFRFGP